MPELVFLPVGVAELLVKVKGRKSAELPVKARA
jgi:hypothetical protein